MPDCLPQNLRLGWHLWLRIPDTSGNPTSSEHPAAQPDKDVPAPDDSQNLRHPWMSMPPVYWWCFLHISDFLYCNPLRGNTEAHIFSYEFFLRWPILREFRWHPHPHNSYHCFLPADFQDYLWKYAVFQYHPILPVNASFLWLSSDSDSFSLHPYRNYAAFLSQFGYNLLFPNVF